MAQSSEPLPGCYNETQPSAGWVFSLRSRRMCFRHNHVRWYGCTRPFEDDALIVLVPNSFGLSCS